VNLRISAEDGVVSSNGDQGMSDELLVSAAKSGDASAFVELSNRHSKKLLRRTYRITRNWQDAEDVLQDSLLKAFIHLKSFEERSSFLSWLTRIAINSALMTMRKRRGYIHISIDGTEDHPDKWDMPALTESPESYYARRESEELLRGAILRLPRTFREAVQVQQEQEGSVQELAQALGISVPAVKSRLSRAKKTLRTALLERSRRSNGNGQNRAVQPGSTLPAGSLGRREISSSVG
jgi:RNA polymerase sigma-70 factor, ECF subfamily